MHISGLARLDCQKLRVFHVVTNRDRLGEFQLQFAKMRARY
jgi:hypothetical protein